MYTEDQIPILFDRIISEIKEGRSVRKILKDKGMPHRTTFDKWLEQDEVKIDQYARALEFRAEAKFESIEDDYNQEPERDSETGKIDPSWVALQRLKIDAKKWELGKMMPKKYGDRIEIDNKLSGEVRVLPPIQWTDSDESNT